ncbi:hypothetical protein [Pelagibacterium sp. H642]|uniref:hypothetical protein n=1 Tax=Pelagibacterium sp. H642 TaxID=1881069 RepID=UPI0028156FEB|nr:hypothetical protein [Pelagibacterium sp. H642]WMT90838.1 hypothetical protein NO934_00850 [Pelagibacterium sp. H642]
MGWRLCVSRRCRAQVERECKRDHSAPQGIGAYRGSNRHVANRPLNTADAAIQHHQYGDVVAIDARLCRFIANALEELTKLIVTYLDSDLVPLPV